MSDTPVVSRSRALEIAEDHLRESGSPLRRVRQVLALDELDFRAPSVYGGPPLEECWIAYVDRPVLALRSSFIVLVSKATGAVVYAGSAQDEG